MSIRDQWGQQCLGLNAHASQSCCRAFSTLIEGTANEEIS